MKFYPALLCCCFWMNLCSAAYSAESEAENELQDTLKQLEQLRTEKKEISSTIQDARHTHKRLQTELVTTGKSMRKLEQALLEQEKEQERLQAHYTKKKALLGERQQSLQAMIQAAIRLSRTPPEAAIMMPGDFKQSLTASRTLKMLSTSIKNETQGLEKDIIELDQLSNEIEERTVQISKQKNALEEKSTTLNTQLKQRTALVKQLTGEEKAYQEKIATLAKRAEDLRGLVSVLEQLWQERETASIKPGKRPRWRDTESRKDLRSFVKYKGNIALPVAGNIKHRFADSLGKNRTSKGLHIRTRERASVITPFDSEVVFKGPFLDYGNLVILRHSDDFHTLLSGFDVSNIQVGEFLLEGEPIGVMGRDNDNTLLYVELRKHNTPVDPAPWLKGV